MRVIFTIFLILSCVISANAEDILVVAHRGASKDAPQNTIPAFELAFKQGADAIECDFHLTKDGHVVCIHDANTKSVAKTNLTVRSSTLAELRALDVGSSFNKAFAGTTIPTISEVFSTIPAGKRIYVEIKCGPEIIPRLIEEINKSGLQHEQIVVICFKASVLAQFKEKAPTIKASWLCSLKNNKKSGALSPPLDEILTTLQSGKIDAFSSNESITSDYIRSLKEHGFGWHVWTINNEATAKKMSELGVNSITTDIPGLMRKYIAQ